ncbi:MAG: RNA polymerase sigma factor [bacterium]
MNDPVFIEQLRQGNREAFKILVESCGDRVFNTALGILQNDDDARDISQEVFIGIFQSVGGFKGDSSLTTWIYRITVQKSLEHIRTRARKKRSGIILSLFGRENQITAPATPFFHPGVLLENKERAAILFEAISRLPESQRVAFTLHKVEILSHAEIAEVMNSTLPAVESLIVRAKQKLRESLSDYYEKNEK